jgi:hypothetical protein
MTATPGIFQQVQNRPRGQLDSKGLLNPTSFAYTFRGDYTGTNLIYKGLARPGSVTSDELWQIAKLAYDGSGNLLSILWPQIEPGVVSTDFIFEWDDRASYTYS